MDHVQYAGGRSQISVSSMSTSNDLPPMYPTGVHRKHVPIAQHRLADSIVSDRWQQDSRQELKTKNVTYERISQPGDAYGGFSSEGENVSSLLISHARNSPQHGGKIGGSSLFKLGVQCAVHVLPILITALLLALNWRNVYWQDAVATSTQSVILQSFQFPVKAHEILIATSIAAIVLHRVRYDLIVRRELPLGFLTSPYRTGEIGYLFSREFWGAAAPRRQGNGPAIQRVTLASLIVFGSILTLVVGPSSGVLMIPKLGWWTVKNPFGNATESYYFKANRSVLWPDTLPAYSCGSWGCPSASQEVLTVWASNLIREYVTPQIQFVGGSSFNRIVTSNSTDYNDGWTATTSLQMRDAEALCSFWNYVLQYNRGPKYLKTPRLSSRFVNSDTFLKPLVQVQCSAQEYNPSASYELPHNSLRGKDPGRYEDVTWPAPELSYDWEPETDDSPTFDFITTESYENAPTLGGMFRVVRYEDRQPMVIPCSVLAYWIPADIWIDPKSDLNSHDGTQNPLQAFNGTTAAADASKWTQISLSDDWLELMGTASINTILETLGYNDNFTVRAGSEGLSWRLSTLLGLWITDGIARFAPSGGVFLLHVGEGPETDEYAYSDIGILEFGTATLPQEFQSWSEYVAANNWLQVSIEVDRYGYAWSFRGLLIKLASAVLISHALLALSQVLVLLHRRWTSNAWSSIGSIVALCLRSNVVQKAGIEVYNPNTSDEKSRLWSTPVGASLDPADEKMKLVLVDQSEEEMVLMGRSHGKAEQLIS